MILVDAGPLVAIVDRRDRHHAWAVATLRTLKEPLRTVWPALTEAVYLVRDVPGAARQVFSLFELGGVRLLPLEETDIPRIRELMEKYGDLPMDLADAALVRVAEREKARRVFTVDRRDFGIYRLEGGGRLGVLR